MQHLAPRAGRALLEHQLGHQRQTLPAGDHCDHALVIHDVAPARHMQVVLFKVALDVGIHVGLLADERLATQLLGPHHAGAARLVVGRRDADEPVIIERLKIQIVGAGVGEEPQLHRAGFQPARDVVIRPLVDLHVDARERCAEARHDLGQPGHASRVEHPQPQCALVHPVDLGNRLVKRLAAGEHLLDGGHELFGGGGQRDAAFGAGEQRKAALGLHARYRVADGGRRDVQPLRRGGKGTQLCYNA